MTKIVSWALIGHKYNKMWYYKNKDLKKKK